MSSSDKTFTIVVVSIIAWLAILALSIDSNGCGEYTYNEVKAGDAPVHCVEGVE